MDSNDNIEDKFDPRRNNKYYFLTMIFLACLVICLGALAIYCFLPKDFSIHRTWKIWQMCSRISEFHDTIVETYDTMINNFVTLEKSPATQNIKPYLPFIPNPGDWLNGKISIV